MPFHATSFLRIPCGPFLHAYSDLFHPVFLFFFSVVGELHSIDVSNNRTLCLRVLVSTMVAARFIELVVDKPRKSR